MASLLIAGFETTATTVGWTANLITRQPQILDRLQDTVDAGEDSYAEAIVTETLRLRPQGSSRSVASSGRSRSTTD